MTEAQCLMVNCRNRAPADEAFCAKHRNDSTPSGVEQATVARIVAWLRERDSERHGDNWFAHVALLIERGEWKRQDASAPTQPPMSETAQ